MNPLLTGKGKKRGAYKNEGNILYVTFGVLYETEYMGEKPVYISERKSGLPVNILSREKMKKEK